VVIAVSADGTDSLDERPGCSRGNLPLILFPLIRCPLRKVAMETVARLAIAAPRRIVVVALLVMVAVGIFGLPWVKNLPGGGFQDPSSESAQAAALLAKKFHRTDSKMLITDRPHRLGTDVG
jgi:hypothetical protein